jgi:outer membrane immunogenic protein
MRNKLISSLAGAAFSFAASGFAVAADMAVKMPVKAPPPAPVPTWTGFYGGIEFGGAWSDEAIAYSPNDPVAARIVNGASGIPGQQPLATFRIPQNGPVGGVEAGYNWQWSNWLLGVEADFSLAGMSGRGTGTSNLDPAVSITESVVAEQSTDWYGTVRGRVGWLATPNLLLFGTGGFAYGRVADNANLVFSSPLSIVLLGVPTGGFSSFCVTNTVCFAGSSAEIRTGWTAGGGLEYLFDQHWSAKVEYQFVDLGTEAVRIVTTPCPATTCAAPPVPRPLMQCSTTDSMSFVLA